MNIYKQEIQDGLKEQLSNSSFSMASPVEIVTDNNDIFIQQSLANLQALGTNLNQQDLFYLKTILVSVGWNKNDDIFLADETWAARNTAEDKPFNLSHTPNIIIGHITGNWAVAEDYSVLDNDTPVDEVPTNFHLLTSAVIYKHLKSRDPEWEETIAQLIDEIKDNKWFVSMECLFSNFDYAFKNEDNSIGEIITRNKDTAFHTKHLRIYGGSGEYNGRKIGRVLRNITFSGKGLVKKPANPQSIIFNSFSENGVNNIQKEIYDMSNENLEKKNADLEKQVAELQQQIKDADVAATQAKIDEMSGSMKEQEDKIAELEKQLTEANQYQPKVEQLEKELKDANDALNAKADELKKIQDEMLKTQRVSTLIDAGVDKVEAEDIVGKFISVNDEQFDAIVAMKKSVAVNQEKKEDDDEEETEETESQTTEALETVEKEEEVNLSTSEQVDEKAELQVALAQYFKNKSK